VYPLHAPVVHHTPQRYPASYHSMIVAFSLVELMVCRVCAGNHFITSLRLRCTELIAISVQ
jgi:hypothetical protein